ncbi:25336_t:CDS:2, partial [Gigaspora rosea]
TYRRISKCCLKKAERVCSSKILTSEAWRNFQQIFEESGMEVCQTRGIVELLEKNIDEASRFVRNLERILDPAINH